MAAHLEAGALPFMPGPAAEAFRAGYRDIGPAADASDGDEGTDAPRRRISEIITISRHLRVPEVNACMNLPPIRDIRDPETPSPTASDESGRSAQTFIVEAVARKRGEARHALARGRDIYAITAPIVVEATHRVLAGLVSRRGAVAAGEAFNAREFLESLSPAHLQLAFW